MAPWHQLNSSQPRSVTLILHMAPGANLMLLSTETALAEEEPPRPSNMATFSRVSAALLKILPRDGRQLPVQMTSA